MLSDGCSHAKSIEYFLGSINSPRKYLATKCDNWDDFQTGKCNNQISSYMGQQIQPGTRMGKYFLSIPYKKP